MPGKRKGEDRDVCDAENDWGTEARRAWPLSSSIHVAWDRLGPASLSNPPRPAVLTEHDEGPSDSSAAVPDLQGHAEAKIARVIDV